MKSPACVGLVVWIAAVAGAQATVTIDWVTVGDPGNAADQNYSGQGAFGSVAYTYQIAKYEVTNAQYAEFLNAADANGTNPNNIYPSSGGVTVQRGITFNSSGATGSKYTVNSNMEDKPVNYVMIGNAMRFANWLQNGQGSASTESGAYDMAQFSNTLVHSGNATVWIPTEDEWYKAAYYQPAAAGGPSDSYWFYPTRSDTAPTVATATSTGVISNPGANVANYLLGAVWNGAGGNLTTVGSAGPLSASYYGTYDQGGNVYEFTEGIISGNYRALRGGSFDGNENDLQSAVRWDAGGGVSVGFRLASAVPEPSRAVFVLGGLGVLLLRRRR